jgi:hypothetical protein
MRHPDIAGESVQPLDSMPTWRARGWVKYGEPADDPNTLWGQIEDEELLAQIAAVEQAAAERTGAITPTDPPSPRSRRQNVAATGDSTDKE